MFRVMMLLAILSLISFTGFITWKAQQLNKMTAEIIIELERLEGEVEEGRNE